MEDSQVDDMREDFIQTYDRAKSVFGTMAFKLDEKLPINMILFDVTLIIVAELKNSTDDVIRKVYASLINYDRNTEDNSETPFEKNIKYHRDSNENIKERLLWIKKIIGELN